jgi:hypothetical protein
MKKSNDLSFILVDSDPISSADLSKKDHLIASNMSDVFFLLRTQQLHGTQNAFVEFKTKAMAKKAVVELKKLGYNIDTNVNYEPLTVGVEWS